MVSSFESIEIKKDNLDKGKKQTDSSDSDIDKDNVPFSMRMKQLYNKRSVNKNPIDCNKNFIQIIIEMKTQIFK